MSAFARTPPPPYYAVIFTSLRPAGAAGDADADDGYAAMADAMVERAATMPGFLGLESARGADGLGLTVSYWRSEADIAHWRADAEHRVARERGRSGWYSHFELRVAKVERAYGGPGAPP